MIETVSACSLGILLGMRHALEPDHIAAVSTLVAERRRARGGIVLGLAWGAGHTATLVGFGVALSALRVQLSARAEQLFELIVAFMLIGFGIRALRIACRAPAQAGVSTAAVAPGEAGDFLRSARRPFAFGLVHGLAGSGALTAALLSAVPTIAGKFVYALLFGLGSALGMAFFSGVAGHAVARATKSGRFVPALIGTSGGLSLGLGVVWGVANAARLLA